MKIDQIRNSAFAMPLTNPSFPRGPYRFFDREYLIVTYRTDVDALRAVVPEPLEISEPLVKYEFIRMPDSTGFGDYTESGQVIPVRFQGQEGLYVHSMYLDNHGPIAGGREIWGFPKKLARPKISRHGDVIVGTLHYGRSLCARATMGYKHRAGDAREVLQSLQQPNFVLKIIPHVDGSARICELVRYHHEEVRLKECWAAPAELQLFRHVFADVAKLPVLEIVSAQHLVADLTLGHGEIVFDYLTDTLERPALQPHAWKEVAHAAR